MADLYFAKGNKLLPSTDKYILRIFNIPAISIRDKNGAIDKNNPKICIEAPQICKEICYAYKRQCGGEIIVYGRRKKNYDETKKPDFVNNAIKVINGTVKHYKNKDVKIIYRIHESGDYYDIDYLHKWVQIAENYRSNPKVLFMSYTKNIQLLKTYLEREKKMLDEINIVFKFSVMEIDTDKGKKYFKTSDYPEKIRIADSLQNQGLTKYTLYASRQDLPNESNELKHCHLGEPNATCASCGMKCYFDRIDIAAVAR